MTSRPKPPRTHTLRAHLSGGLGATWGVRPGAVLWRTPLAVSAPVLALAACSYDFDVAAKDVASDAASDASTHADTTDAAEAMGDSTNPFDREPPDSCAPYQKICDGTCVAVEDPAYGCGVSSCQPCDLEHAQVTCDGSQCRMVGCELPWLDCDDEAPGCETHSATQSDHCGRCDRSCFGGACIDGFCAPHVVAAVSGVDYPGALVLDGSQLFFSMSQESGSSRVWRVPKSGGTPTELLLLTSRPALAVDATHLYFTDGGLIRRWDKQSGQATNVADIWNVRRMALTDTDVFFSVGGATTGSVRATLKATGAEQRVLAENERDPLGIAVGGGLVYWTNHNVGRVRSVPESGGTPSDVSSADGNPSAVAVCGSVVVWSDDQASAIFRSGDSTPLAPVDSVKDLAVDCEAGGVAWVSSSTSQVGWVSLEGGPPTILAPPSGCCAGGITMDSAWVYWTQGVQVVRVPR